MTVNLRRYAPSIVRHPNRPDPAPVIRPRCDVIVWHDSDTVTLDHLTRAEAERLYRLAQTDVHLFGLCYVMEQVLGMREEEVA